MTVELKIKGGSKCPAIRPSSVLARINAFGGQPQPRHLGLSSPLRGCECLSAKREMLIISPVILLLHLRGPANIPRFIAAVVVFAINCMGGRGSCSYMGKKGGKVVAPLGRDLNTTTAVAFIGRVVRIFATRDYSIEDVQLWRLLLTSLGIAVNGQLLTSKTPARKLPTKKSICANKHDLAAVAKTFPLPYLASLLLNKNRARLNGEFSIALADWYIDSWTRHVHSFIVNVTARLVLAFTAPVRAALILPQEAF